ncbi:hypothetical protein ACFWNT_11030 [Streptomyces sp. NPDC058409]|uniref:hypothetical protein n=1 Tax=Streptomyces sp. NPDC058409 TaxID=3346484 RepID=UPI00365B8D3B
MAVAAPPQEVLTEPTPEQRFNELKDRLIAATGSPGLTSFHDGRVHMTLGEWQRLIARLDKALTVPTTDGSALRTTRTILREGLDGSVGAKAFFRDCISEALNRAADDVSALAPETEQVHDATNLVVCAGLHYLENPGATLHQAIEANYEEDVDDVLG